MNEKCCTGTRLFCHLPTALTHNPMSQLAFLSQLAYSPNPTKSSLWKGFLIEQFCLQEISPKEMCEARRILLPGFSTGFLIELRSRLQIKIHRTKRAISGTYSVTLTLLPVFLSPIHNCSNKKNPVMIGDN